jgi:hypothetical protein
MRRAIVTVAAGLAATAALTACDKPLPNLTVLSGSTTIVVSPQAYCADATHCHFPQLLVDVPRQVAGKPWVVVSASQKSDGTFEAITGANYTSGTITHRHTASVDVPYGVGSYYLVVTQKSASVNGSWVAEVTIKH